MYQILKSNKYLICRGNFRKYQILLILKNMSCIRELFPYFLKVFDINYES